MFVGSSGRSRYSAQDHSRGKTELNQFVLDKCFSSFSTLSIPYDVFCQSALLSKSSVWKQTSLICPLYSPSLPKLRRSLRKLKGPSCALMGRCMLRASKTCVIHAISEIDLENSENINAFVEFVQRLLWQLASALGAHCRCLAKMCQASSASSHGRRTSQKL